MDKIRQLARQYGTKIWKRSCSDDYAFNGKTIAEFDDKAMQRRRSDSDLIHDIAHFVVASPDRKNLPEFGLGDSPDTGMFSTPLAKGMTMTMAWKEEELASAFGIYLERKLGLGWRDTFKTHSWDDPSMPTWESKIFDMDANHKFALALQELKRRGII